MSVPLNNSKKPHHAFYSDLLLLKTLRNRSWFDEKVTAQYIKAACFDHRIESLKAYIRDREKRNQVMFFLGFYHLII
jgi:hypothetical protein